MKLKIIIFLIVLLNWNCNKGDGDSGTDSTAFWVNKSSHKVHISPYAYGSVRGQFEVILNPGEKVQIAEDFVLGKNSVGAGFYSDYLPSDSIIVTFDDTYNISHYFSPVQNTSPKYYAYNSTRNLGNILSYEGRIVRETDIYIELEYEYNFTDQDYLDAR